MTWHPEGNFSEWMRAGKLTYTRWYASWNTLDNTEWPKILPNKLCQLVSNERIRQNCCSMLSITSAPRGALEKKLFALKKIMNDRRTNGPTDRPMDRPGDSFTSSKFSIEVKLLAPLGNYNWLTDRPTDQQPTEGHEGSWRSFTYNNFHWKRMLYLYTYKAGAG